VRGSAARGGASRVWLTALGLWGLWGLCGPGGSVAGPTPTGAGLRGAAISADGPASASETPSGDSTGTGSKPGADRSDLEGAPIARVEFEATGIFDPLPAGRLRPFYRLANRLHTRTRASTLRRHVLLAAGDRWVEARAQESERAMRALDIFNLASVDARREGDSAVVTVRTRDAWTTSPEFTVERGGGRLFGSIQFSERNLFGRAQYVSLAYREGPDGISRSIEAADPAVAGTRVRAMAGAGNGSIGTFEVFTLERPFFAEDTRCAFGIRAERTRAKARLFASGLEAATFHRRNQRVELYAGMGRRHGRTIARVTGTLLAWDRRLGVSVLAPGAPPEFAGGDEESRVRRFTIEGLLWRPRFVERTRVDRLDGVEDFDLGPSLAVAGGYSPHAFGGSVEEGFASCRLGLGVDGRGAGFGWMRATAQSRIDGGLREATARLDARWVNQSIARHTLVLAALGTGGRRTARDFQLVVGGLNGLRAHDVHALAGDRLWRLNAESRWLIGRELLHLVSLGAAGFWDAARMSGPGSDGLPWQHDVGLGLRLSPARSALSRVARFDVAWRVSPSGSGLREAVFSFSSSQAF